jgi:hypothetical protein
VTGRIGPYRAVSGRVHAGRACGSGGHAGHASMRPVRGLRAVRDAAQGYSR